MVDFPAESGGVLWGSRFPANWPADAHVLFNEIDIDIDITKLNETKRSSSGLPGTRLE